MPPDGETHGKHGEYDNPAVQLISEVIAFANGACLVALAIGSLQKLLRYLYHRMNQHDISGLLALRYVAVSDILVLVTSFWWLIKSFLLYIKCNPNLPNDLHTLLVSWSALAILSIIVCVPLRTYCFMHRKRRRYSMRQDCCILCMILPQNMIHMYAINGDYPLRRFWPHCLVFRPDEFRDDHFERIIHIIFMIVDYSFKDRIMIIFGSIYYTNYKYQQLGDYALTWYDYWCVIILLSCKVIIKFVYTFGTPYVPKDLIHEISNRLEQYYIDMGVQPPDKTLEQCLDEYPDHHMMRDDYIMNLHLAGAEWPWAMLHYDFGNFPLKEKPIDERQRSKMISDVFDQLIDENYTGTIHRSVTNHSYTQLQSDEHDEIDFMLIVGMVDSNEHDQYQCHEGTTNPLQDCPSIQRLISLLEMYEDLDVINNNEDQNMFVRQMNDTRECKYFLDDYIHLISDHSHQLETICVSLDPCNDIARCVSTSRNYQTDNMEEMKLYTEEDDDDEVLNFYINTMDSLHFYLYHLFDVGLRMQSDKKHPNQSLDKEFSRMYEEVNKSREISK